eukprot:c12646_g6_i3.p1 GENE.c12646_g6_i3~~c12646_g6_i3.p1  ORF type:complete len:291 (-),score=66.73 c12646_g6_i3:173-1045(-)
MLLAVAPSLTALTLVEAVDTIDFLVATLPHLTKLTTLSLLSNRLGDKGMRKVSAAMCRLANITSLNIGANNIQAGLGDVCANLLRLTNLKTLDLWGSRIGQEQVNHVVSMIPRFHHLTDLNLATNAFETQGMLQLCDGLALCPKLKKLNLARNRIGPEGARGLSIVLANLPHLTELNLCHNNIENEAMELLCEQLERLTEMKSLNLAGNQLCATGIFRFVDAMKKLSYLTALDLSENSMTDEDATAVCQCILETRAPPLATINISANKWVSPDTARKLAAKLPKVKFLAS